MHCIYVDDHFVNLLDEITNNIMNNCNAIIKSELLI